MRVLLDENLPHRLRSALVGHDVFTARYMGWAGIQNGKLLKLVEEAAFDVFVTADQNMRNQQNLAGRPMGIVCLTAQEWRVLSRFVDKILAAIDTASPGSFESIECKLVSGNEGHL